MFITLQPQKLRSARKRASLNQRVLAHKIGIQAGTLAIIEDLHCSILVPRQFLDRLIQQLGAAVSDVTIVPSVGFQVKLVKPCNTNDAPSVNGLREVVMTRDKSRCVYCGSLQDLDVDHVVPTSRGGPTIKGNLVVSCRRCNNLKGDCVPSEVGMRIHPDTMAALKRWWRDHNKERKKPPQVFLSPPKGGSFTRWWCNECLTTVWTDRPGNDVVCDLCKKTT